MKKIIGVVAFALALSASTSSAHAFSLTDWIYCTFNGWSGSYCQTILNPPGKERPIESPNGPPTTPVY